MSLSFTPTQRLTLLFLSIVGFLGPNGVFLWVAATQPGAMMEAMRQPVAAVFIAEAFFLMFFFAWLIHRAQVRPGAGLFILFSLVGSLAFSVPFWLWLVSRQKR